MKRQIIVDGDVAYIPLTRGYVSVIDAADVGLVDGFNWYAKPIGNTVYAVRKCSAGEGKQRDVQMHRVILGLTDAVLCGDHIDLDGLNNRRSNLRACSQAENQRNRRASKNNTSGFKGVTWNTVSGKWLAQIWANGAHNYLGVFDSPLAAHDAYRAAAADLHGEFARAA